MGFSELPKPPSPREINEFKREIEETEKRLNDPTRGNFKVPLGEIDGIRLALEKVKVS
ncbi:hypothetical protein KJ632_02160 [Patescibacteria group bacterium]|nr:hypothetical protein [Patescibacteria group bacterium]